jgi:VanZ family protein
LRIKPRASENARGLILEGQMQQGSLPKKILKYWAPVAIMLGVMYYFSTDVFSGENTRSLIEVILGWFVPEPATRMVNRFNFYVRKAGHFVEYAMLAMLLFRAFRADSPKKWKLAWAVYSMTVVICWSLVDEFHQTLTWRRGGSLYDSALDSAGGLFGVLLIGVISCILERRKRR